MDDATRIFAFPRNLVLAASAGTGKTHSLVGVVLHALLGASELGRGDGKLHDRVDPSRIVATTFSRKAAAEIRARIAESLEALASGAPSLYRASIDRITREATGATLPEGTLRERARLALERLPNAQIGTLHGFASSIVRMYAMELGISPGFEFEDEAESRARLQAAVGRVLEKRAEAQDADVALLAQAAGGVDALLNQLVQALMRLEEDGRGASSIEVMADDEAKCAETFAEYLAVVRPLIDEAKLEGEARDLFAALADVEAGIAGADVRLVDASRALCKKPKAKGSDALARFFAFREEAYAKKSLTNPEIGEKLANNWLHRHAFVQRGQAAKDLIVACEEEVRTSSRSEATLGFGDVLRHARDVLRDHPQAAAELGRKYDLLLVDEFQDTSRLQRELVQLVWDRSASTRAPGTIPSIGELRGSGLLVVGDRKQSIYGFRGADVSVFAEFCVGLAGETARRALGIPAGDVFVPDEPLADFVPLRHNRRGEAELLAFANVLSAERFQPESQPPALYEITYNPATEDLATPPERVREANHVAEARTTWLRLPAKQTKKLDDARVLAERIVAMHAAEAPRVKGEPPKWRDMAVLARRNDMLEAAAHALAERGVPYVVAGRGFYTTREVRDLAAMLALLLDPSDRHAMVQVLRGPWAGVRDETLIGLTDEGRGLARVGPAWDLAAGERRSFVHPDDWTALGEVRRVVESLAPELDRVGAGVALRAAVRELRLEETWIQLSRGAQRVANGRKLLAMADLAPSARVLIDQLDDAAKREDAETEAATFSEDEDAVRLLTIHASKGLDFPIVFLPQLATVARPPGGLNAFWLTLGTGRGTSRIAATHIDADGRPHEPPSVEELRSETLRRDSAELQRLTYVAVTRASEAMVLVGAEGKGKTTAAAMAAIAADDEKVARAHLAIEDVVPPEMATLAFSEVELEPPPLTEPTREVPRWRSLPIAPTALQDFARCPRRFQLVHLLHLPEPDLPPFARTQRDAIAAASAEETSPRLDVRAEGTLAHRVLERIEASAFGGQEKENTNDEASRLLAREGIAPTHPRHAVVVERVVGFLGGEYARRAAEASAGLVREEPFVLHVDAKDDRAVVLRGTIDLVVVWPDGSVDVLDYKSARGPDAAPYAFQLDVYAHAARARWPDAPRLRTGIVFLGGDASEPSWREPRAAKDLEASLAKLGSDLVLARWRDVFPAANLRVCKELRCGYQRACHPPEVRSSGNVPSDISDR